MVIYCFNTLLILVIQLLTLTDDLTSKYIPKKWRISWDKNGQVRINSVQWRTASQDLISFGRLDPIASIIYDFTRKKFHTNIALRSIVDSTQPPNPLRQHISKKHKGLQGCVYKKYSSNKKNLYSRICCYASATC